MINLRQVNLNLLVALDVLLKERNVTRSGERLCLSQSAMSGILSRLRHLFDDELLVRVGRNLEPTAFGEEIAEPVHHIIQQLENLINAKRPFDPKTENRQFQIAATDYAVLLILGPLVARLEKLAPNISVQFVKLDTMAKTQLSMGEIDFSIMPVEIKTGFPSLPLFEDDWTCIARASHPEIGDRLSFDEFISQPHMGFNFGDSGPNSMADEFFTNQGIERNIVAITESLTNAPFLLSGTSLLTVVPKRLAVRLQKAANIKLLDLPLKVPTLSENLNWNPRFTSSPAHIWFREQIVEIGRAL